MRAEAASVAWRDSEGREAKEGLVGEVRQPEIEERSLSAGGKICPEKLEAG
jgi:hypothetical protein